MKILSKIGVIFIILVCIFIAVPENNISNASVSSMVKGTKPDEIDTTIGNDLASDVISKILGFLQVASGLISVIIIAFSGFQYIIAETADLKGEVKKKMLPLVLGIVLVFSATTIAKFLIAVVADTSSSNETVTI